MNKVKCELCKGFGLVQVKTCKHCVICPHCRGHGHFIVGNPDDLENLKRVQEYAKKVSKYKKEFIAYNTKNKPPLGVIL